MPIIANLTVRTVLGAVYPCGMAAVGRNLRVPVLNVSATSIIKIMDFIAMANLTTGKRFRVSKFGIETQNVSFRTSSYQDINVYIALSAAVFGFSRRQYQRKVSFEP